MCLKHLLLKAAGTEACCFKIWPLGVSNNIMQSNLCEHNLNINMLFYDILPDSMLIDAMLRNTKHVHDMRLKCRQGLD